MLDSVVTVALTSALNGLSERQRAIADNISNVNTPGYRAKRVQFEDALAASVRAGSGAAAATTGLSMEPTQLNGNNVNLDTETLSNIETTLRYQFAAQAVNGEFTAMRTVLKAN
ncbi:flagellar basal body rod protein FlgB [Specibacter cremeus]|uniref:flagellar basal body rod protein FlgB n=1 Tax=Specibacter cremeus TaxID=1629051 RepID=UPI000F77F6CC|nr:flagellar basal body protein [Specibacter cremeus]